MPDSTVSPSVLRTIRRWFDTSCHYDSLDPTQAKRIDWVRAIPFITLQLMCLGVFWVGWSWIALAVTGVVLGVRMFAITGFYHRYFSHRTFKTSRPAQFVFAVLGASAVQRGPLWWAAHHRHHHRAADEADDVHSPIADSFLWSHILWVMSRGSYRSNWERVGDLARYPELRFLDRFDVLVPAVLATGLFLTGSWLGSAYPSLGTSGWQMLIWGFFVSTVVLFHFTSTINSLAHLVGRRRFPTPDHSRNNAVLAVLTLGEGWHNNHHHFPGATRQGFYWWEIDVTFYLLKAMSWVGLVWDLNAVPKRVYEEARRLRSAVAGEPEASSAEGAAAPAC